MFYKGVDSNLHTTHIANFNVSYCFSRHYYMHISHNTLVSACNSYEISEQQQWALLMSWSPVSRLGSPPT